MAERNQNNYFFKALFTILIALITFVILKNILPKEILDNRTVATNGIVVDSMALAAMSDTLDIDKLLNDSLDIDSTITKTHPSSDLTIVATDYSSGYGNLEHFFSKLAKLEATNKGKVRIAYFSDSMTDGDLIVQDIRSQYQKKYGGKGVGFVGVTSLSAASRGSIIHSYSKNWSNQSMLKTKKPRRAFGIDGQVVFEPKGQTAWIKYQAGNIENSTLLYNPTFFYGSSTNKKGNLSIQQNSDSITTHNLNTDNLLNTVKLEGAPQNIKYTFSQADSIPFYGVNFDDGQGVHVDNFSIRGNSGLPLSLLSKDLMNAFDRVLQYDLIVLHYGANVLNYGTTDYSWYKKAMTNVVNHLKQCFPNADILIISTADKSNKIDQLMKTSPAVLPLIKAQKEYANETGSGFINLYSLMGGDGSMVQWVEQKPALANKDYTHFSIKGAHKIGGLIYDDLQKGYYEYKKLKPMVYDGQ